MRTLCWVAAVVALVVTAGPAAAKRFDSLFVAGDSLSDDGNLFAITSQLAAAYPDLVAPTPPSPPYFAGRFSNGPVWVEHLADRLGLEDAAVRNVAQGGAKTAGHTAYDQAPPQLQGALRQAGVRGVRGQVTEYLAGRGPVSADGLYVVWGGALDYLSQPPLGGRTAVARTVTKVRTTVSRLAAAGAEHFLVPNLPDLGRIPRTSGDPAVATALSTLTDAHNAALATTMDRTARQLDLDIRLLDVARYFDEAFASVRGFANVTTPCITRPDACADALFFDDLHPTARAHAELGDLAYTRVVPLPASIALLAPAVAGLGWAAQRRRAAPNVQGS